MIYEHESPHPVSSTNSGGHAGVCIEQGEVGVFDAFLAGGVGGCYDLKTH